MLGSRLPCRRPNNWMALCMAIDIKDDEARWKERLVIRRKATQDEEALYDLMFEFEEKYFEDLTLTKFEHSKITKVEHEGGEIEYANIDVFKVTIAECLIKIMDPDTKESVAAEYEVNEDAMIFYKGNYERGKKETLLHEMIHAYDHYLIKYNNLWRDYLVLFLYNKILKTVGKRRLQKMMDTECNTLFMASTAHGIFFLLKSLDLDIRLNKKLGTIFGYGRKERYGNLNSRRAK